MARIKEPLSNGLMTGPDPALLPPGTLSYIRNGVYLPNTLALQRAAGRVVFGSPTASASDINGLRDIQFDNGDHILVAQVSSTGGAAYTTASVEGAGTFGVLTTAVTAGASLECIHYQNRFYLFNGVTAAVVSGLNSNGVVYLTSTAAGTPPVIRQHGMAPVSAIGPSATALSAFAASASGFYEYWTTEVYKYTQDGVPQELESTFGGSSAATPLTVYVSSTSVAPVIQLPPLVNPLTTHWRIYRSPIKTFSTDKAFPDGFLVGEYAVLTGTAALNQFVDTSSATVGSQGLPGGVSQSVRWSSPNNVLLADGSYASGSATAGVSGWNTGFQPAVLYLSGFNLGGFNGPVLGIDVEVKAYVASGSTGLAGGPLGVVLGKRNPDTGYFAPGFGGSRVLNVSASASASPQVLTFGGSADRWSPPDQPPFVDTDFSTNFMCALYWYGTPTLGVDYVKVRAYYGAGANNAAVIPFPSVVYTFGDVTVEVGKNGPPPSCNTGDIYEGCLVTNSVTEPKLVRYSYPDAPEYFPSTYYLGFQTKDNDQVTLVKTVNNRLVVGLGNSLWRVNYLPSERDASFDRGLAVEPISRQYGVVNAMCACVFSVDGENEHLAFVSQKGIHLTDAYHISTQTQNLNWRQILDTAGQTSTPIALVNDPENQELLFYYRNDALTPETYMCLHLNYSLTHMGTLHSDTGPSRTFENALKISGPVHMRNAIAGDLAGVKSAWPVRRANGDTTVFLGYGAATASATAAGAGKVYYETGTTLPAADNALRFRTRRMLLAGEGAEFRANEVYAYIGSYTTAGGALGIDMATQTIKTNDDAGEVTETAKTVAWAGRKLGKWQFRQMCEGLVLSAAITGNPNNDAALEYLLIDGEGYQGEDSGR